MRRAPLLSSAALALGLAAVPPPAAFAQDQCYGGACADGYRGCGCSAACCQQHLQQASGGGGGYDPASAEMATMNILASFYQSFAQGVFAASRQQATDGAAEPQAQAAAEARQQAAAMQERVLAQQAAAFAARRDELSAQLKGDAAPDLSKPLEMKSDEPAPRRREKPDPDAACRRRLPHDFRDPAVYAREASAWDRACGSGKVADALLRAPSSAAAAVLLYESRLARLWDKGGGQTADDVWEGGDLLRAGSELKARFAPEEERFVEAALPRSPFDPDPSVHYSLLEGLPAPASVPMSRRLGEALAAGAGAIEKGIGSVTDPAAAWVAGAANARYDVRLPSPTLPSPPKGATDWKGVGAWVREKKAAFLKEEHRAIAELGGGGAQNEEAYSP